MENNNVGYSVNGGNALRKVSRAAKPFGIISLICGIISFGLIIINTLVFFDVLDIVLLKIGLSINNSNSLILRLTLISIVIGIVGIVFGVIAINKDKKYAIGKAGFILSIIDVAWIILIFVRIVTLLVFGFIAAIIPIFKH